MSNKWKLYSKVSTHKIIEYIEVFYPRYLTFPKAYFLSSSGTRMYYGIKKLVEKLWPIFPFDIIHAHMALPDGYAAMLLSSDYNKPLVVTFQATDLDITANRDDKCLQSLQKVFFAADKVISPSPRLSRQFSERFKIPPDTMGYGINPEDVFYGNSNLSAKYKNYRVLLSVSRLIPTKGIDLNLHALKKIIDRYDNLLYLIIGDGPARQDLINLTYSLGLDKHVKFIGQLPHKKVVEYMSICEIFTMPSWQETFGLAYVEAMAHGKPIIGCKGQGVDGIVEHGKTGLLVKPKNVDSLVEAVNFLLSHSNEAQEIGRRSRDLVLEKYTWERSAGKLVEVYRYILKRRRKT
jgi:glycosyltransferase involved in cell wall biosynthesis